jgi:hypothetical protein
MLTAIDVTNPSGDTLQFPVQDPQGGYIVREVTGLDPVNASLITSTLAQVDGAQMQNSRRDVRNITMKLGLKPNYTIDTVQSLKSALYDYLMPKANVNLGFYIDGSLYVITSGQVETFENAMFSANPEVDISIICYDPDLYAPASVTVSDHTQSDNITTKTVQYNGTSEAGIIYNLHVNRNLSSFSLTNTNPDNVNQKVEFTGSFIPGDEIVLNTIKGQKAVTLTRAGITTSILYFMSSSPIWPSLKKGANLIGAFAPGIGISYDLIYTPKFGGI